MEGAEDESSPILSFLLPDEFDVCENDMVPGFMAGDIRVNENPGKVSIVIKVIDFLIIMNFKLPCPSIDPGIGRSKHFCTGLKRSVRGSKSKNN